MTKNVLKKFGFVRIAFAASVGFPLLIVTSASAQNPAAGEATTERVIVTGSNIPTAETESALPVTTYTAEIITKAGANTPAEGLRQLPSYIGATATENNANGGNGQANITLRGLGPLNTLTLMDGRRVFNYSDINAIPISAVDHIEVLKDGASSVYGSDAVAGVVNFVMLNGPGGGENVKPYEGAEIYGLYGNTTDTDARVLQGWIRGGVTAMDGRVSIAAAGEYYDRHDLLTRDRGFPFNNADTRAFGGQNTASPTYPGRISYRTNPAGPPFSNASVLQVTLVDQTTVNPLGGAPSPSYRTFDPGGAGTDPDRFNFRAFTNSIPGQERAMYYVTGRYKIFDDMFQIYGDILYSKQKQNNFIAPSPFTITNTRQLNTSPFNPFLDADAAAPHAAGNFSALPSASDDQLRTARYRLIRELGVRKSVFDQDYWRYLVGFNGDFNFKNNQFVSNAAYDAGFWYERFDQVRIDSGDAQRHLLEGHLNPTDAANAVNNPTGNNVGVLFDPFIGEFAPTSGVANTYLNGVLTGTAPYDNTAVAQEASYIGHSFSYERDYAYDIKANANLFPELWNGGVGVALGYEHRNSQTHSLPDPVQSAGDQLGYNASPNTKFLQEVDGYFGELRVPLVISSNNVPFLRSAEIDFAYRFETFDNTNQFAFDVMDTKASFDSGGTPRVAIRIEPIPDILIRASYGQSFRAPFPFQEFQPLTQNFPQLFDALKNGAFQPPSGVWETGNAGLQPETTDSYAAGIVLTPRFVRNWTGGSLTTSVDFFQVMTKNLIVSADDHAQLLLTANAQSGGVVNAISLTRPDGSDNFGGPPFGVARDAQNNVVFINSHVFNAGKRLVNGIDVNTVYQLPTQNWGQFTWTFGYNYFFTWKASPGPGAPLVDFLGKGIISSIPLAPGTIPYHKAFLRGEWEGNTGWMNGLDFVMTGNYISSYHDDSSFLLDPTQDRRVSDYTTLDMQLSYEFRKPAMEAAATSGKEGKDAKSAMSAPVGGADNGTFFDRMLWGTKLTVGVNDAFDRNPPSALGTFNDSYDTSLFTIRNRYWYSSITKKF